MPLIDIIAGARPNFMKIAPIIRAIKQSQSSGGTLEYRLVHTGQHYDERMSASFFKQLGIPDPNINLEVGSGTQAEQTAKIMMRYEALLLEKPSKLCLVVGDVTSTMACAIAAQKLCIPVAHVEAGIRSGDWSMPEEINRMVTDSITNYFFTTSQYANQNLQEFGVSDDRIFFVGNTMIDTLLHEMDRLSAPDCFESLGLLQGNYIVLTLHRPANVDAEQHLTVTLEAIMQHAGSLPVVFPVHPRTAKQLEHIHTSWDNLHCVEPLPYLQFNYLVQHAKAVITDSGGITEETTVMGIPCMTLRDSTERPETVDVGTNELIGSNPENIPPAMERLLSGQWKKGAIPEKWDGKAAERIVEVLERCV
ncbi:UDP-N-acetylglucosamine 2-epimerase (non-hydrolyzing) [Verrucomicrobia bacterium]|nr:UDP-N-acetylglucosamine 2-epimerase (non-hydrolyzing) [Verrucomicrobiota bacterium]MDB4665138.1 UDP-N-acetylglucosamine 2-epimerase (non-hydrolyzing) [Verrucomicrobiota bacterium]